MGSLNRPGFTRESFVQDLGDLIKGVQICIEGLLCFVRCSVVVAVSNALLTDVSIQASASRTVYLIAKYWLPLSDWWISPLPSVDPLTNGLLQLVQNKASRNGGRDTPPGNLAGEDIDHKGHIDHPHSAGDIGEVRDPELVGSRRRELPVDLITWGTVGQEPVSWSSRA